MHVCRALRLALVIGILAPQMVRAQHEMPGVLGIPMHRASSGTSWIPDALSLPTRSTMHGAWNLMTRATVFAQYNHQSGPRGDDQFGSLNSAMLMAGRSLGGGQLQFRTMLSLDAAGVTARGYPLLLQTGESQGDIPIHDRQHPHDFWMELGASYDRAFDAALAFQAYVAAVGEPALGPVAFTDRPSSFDNPLAPIGHHWQDASHISFGVVTFGVYTPTVKIESSIFNGREPDDQRYDFDMGPLDSHSARVTVNPSPHWSGTLGYGRFAGSDEHGPMHRVVGSLMHGVHIGTSGQWATTLIAGWNRHEGLPASHAVLIESELMFSERNAVFARVESGQKSVADLVISDPLARYDSDHLFNIQSASLGYVRELGRVLRGSIGVGARGTVNFVPEGLEPFYGSRTPIGALAYIRWHLGNRGSGH